MALLRFTLCALRSGTHFDLLTGRKRLESRGHQCSGAPDPPVILSRLVMEMAEPGWDCVLSSV